MSAEIIIFPTVPTVRTCAHEVVSESGDVGQCRLCGKWFFHAMIGDYWIEAPDKEEGE